VLRHAARALELLPATDRAWLEARLVATLAEAISNDPEKGDGAAIWHRDVLPDAERVGNLAGAVAALRALAPDALDDPRMPAHRWRVDGDDVILEERRTSRTSRWRATTATLGVLAIRTTIGQVPGNTTRVVDISAYPEPLRQLLRDLATPIILDAALLPGDAAAMRAGLLDADSIRQRALAGAWQLVARDGVDDAGIVVHGALDLYHVEHLPIPAPEQAEALVQLAGLPASPMRTALMERFGIG
jgi:hypothetical protein